MFTEPAVQDDFALEDALAVAAADMDTWADDMLVWATELENIDAGTVLAGVDGIATINGNNVCPTYSSRAGLLWPRNKH